MYQQVFIIISITTRNRTCRLNMQNLISIHFYKPAVTVQMTVSSVKPQPSGQTLKTVPYGKIHKIYDCVQVIHGTVIMCLVANVSSSRLTHPCLPFFSVFPSTLRITDYEHVHNRISAIKHQVCVRSSVNPNWEAV